MKISRPYLFISLVILEIILIIVITLLFFKLIDILINKTNVSQYITKLSKLNYSFNKQSTNLKYFYEPNPNKIIIESPEWLDYSVKHIINSDGIQSTKEFQINKPKDTFRIITIGDSFTFGAFVNTDENFSSILETLLNNITICPTIRQFEIINLGVGGYYIDYTVERFLKRGLKYNPDLVIWLINSHNMRRSNELTRPILDQLYSEGIQGYDPITKTYPAATTAEKIVSEKYSPEYIANYQKNVLNKLKISYFSNLLVMTMKDNFISNSDILNEFIRSKSNYFYYSDLVNTIANKKYSLPDSHPNKEGHKIIAEEILNYLLQNYLFTCSINTKRI